MAKEKKEAEHGKREHKPEGKSETKAKAKKLILETLSHTRLPDGSYVHHHHYKQDPNEQMTMPPRMMGTSKDLQGVHEHIDDHWGDQEPADGQEAEGEAQEPAAGPGDQEEEAQG